MKSPDGATTSSWYGSVRVPAFPALGKTAEADVCVVGAGIAGLMTAYLLAREGKKVIVLDEGPVGGGQTGRTSAHLTSALDDRFAYMEKMHGVEATRLAYESHAEGIDLIEEIAEREKIGCDLARVDGVLSAGEGQSERDVREEFEAAKRAGVKELRWGGSGGLGGAACVRFGGQARFHPMKFVAGLARAFTSAGGKIYTGRRVTDVQGADPEKRQRARASTGSRVQVRADQVVVATNTPAPINDWFGIYTKQAAYRTYVIGASVPRGAVKDELLWDMAEPYHYVRLQVGRGSSDVLLIGGEDHRVGQMERGSDPFAKLEAWARPLFPEMGKVRFRWSGQVQEPADGLAFMGHALTAKEGVFVITGDSGMGLTHAAVGAKLVTDQISGRENRFGKLYDPSRKIANVRFAKENANVVAQYKDWVTPGETWDEGKIKPGEGAVVRKGFKKLAVYRDEGGKIHRHSAACTHLQCVVHWNAIEKTWDCPCHGGRFDPKGKVLMGPPVDDLAAE